MSRTLRSCLAAALLACAGSGSAAAGDSLWLHNGSVMYYHAQGASRTFTYYKPRRGLERLRGKVLFSGQKHGWRMAGTAYTFRRGCAPAPYSVGGDAATPGRIVLDGAAPVRARGGCAVTGYSRNNGNARLVFTYLRAVQGSGMGAPRPGGTSREEPDSRPARPFYKGSFTVPGGGVTVSAVDADDPAQTPIRVTIGLYCEGVEGPVRHKVVQVCDLDSAQMRTANGLSTLFLTTRRFSPALGRCGPVRVIQIPFGRGCLGG